MADWFTNLANQAMKLADDLADSLVSQANEAQQQLIMEQKKMEVEETQRQQIFNTHHNLPWETDVESRQILSKDLMEKIFLISLQEHNFTTPAANAEEIRPDFYFQDFIPVAMQLLQLDLNLARAHAKLSPKMKSEEEFWFNYYCRVMYLRARSGIDGSEALARAGKYSMEDMVAAEASPVESHSKPAPSRTLSSPTPVTPPEPTTRPNTVTKTSSPPSQPLSQPQSEDNTSLKDLELLEELEDLSPEDFENIGSSECNEELEAQIAQELAADRS